MHSDEITRILPFVQADYTAETNETFEHFFCPLLMRDEPVELCMGHVIPQCLPHTMRTRVVQRKDIDNFYGAHAEADFCTLVKGRAKSGLKDIMDDPDLFRRLRQQLGKMIPVKRVGLSGSTCEGFPIVSNAVRTRGIPPSTAERHADRASRSRRRSGESLARSWCRPTAVRPGPNAAGFRSSAVPERPNTARSGCTCCGTAASKPVPPRSDDDPRTPRVAS